MDLKCYLFPHQTATELLLTKIHGSLYAKSVHCVNMFNAEDVNEDLKIALRKRAEIDAKYLMMLVQDDTPELKQSLTRWDMKSDTLVCFLQVCFIVYV